MKKSVECPNCKHKFSISLELTCQRCGYKWLPRSDVPPKVCPNPKCKSPYWDRPRKTKHKNNKK